MRTGKAGTRMPLLSPALWRPTHRDLYQSLPESGRVTGRRRVSLLNNSDVRSAISAVVVLRLRVFCRRGERRPREPLRLQPPFRLAEYGPASPR